MKRFLLLLAAACFLSLGSYSQCTPDISITQPGITPDSATNLPHALVGTAYSTVMQIRAPKDTTAKIGSLTLPLTVDSIVLQSFTGLPPGFTFVCSPAGCSFPGNTNGCVLISGPAPIISQAGMVYNLTATVRSYLHVTGIGTKIDTPNVITYYYIQVDNPAGINAIGGSKLSVIQNHPNPFSKTSLIEYYAPSGGEISLTISNLLGKAVLSKTIIAQQGSNKITLVAKDFRPGVYFYTITSDKQSITKRMIVDSE